MVCFVVVLVLCLFVSVSKLRAVNPELSKFKLIDGRRQNVSVTETGEGTD